MFAPFRLSSAILALGALVAAAGISEPDPAPAKLPPPPTFTLKSDKVTLRKALADLTRQTGVAVDDRRAGADVPLRLSLDKVTFWQGLDALAAAAGARVDLYQADGRLALVDRPDGYRPPPVSHDGYFRLALKKVVTSLDLESGGGTCTVTCEAAWLRPLLLLEERPQGLKVWDTKGKPVPAPEAGSSLVAVDGRNTHTFDFELPLPPRSEARIGRLEGKLSAVGPNKMLTFHFDTLDRLHDAKAGAPLRRLTQEGVTCRIDKVVLSKERWTVRVVLDYPLGGARLESFRSGLWVAHNELRLVSKDGKRTLPSSSYVLEDSSSRKAVLSYHFRDKKGAKRGRPSDWRLDYTTPALIVDFPVTFSFKDVRLR